MSADAPTLHSIQALRGCSALWVLLYHALPAASAGSSWWHTLASYGYLGVDIFFVISGFIMALNTSATPAGHGQSLRFALLRLWRIYSGWWPVFFLSLLTLGWGRGWPLHKDLVGSWWLYSINIDTLLLPVTWTLTFELYFYAVVALTLLLAPRWRTAILLCLAVLVAALNLYWFSHTRYTLAQLEHSHWGMYLFASPLCLEFALGYLLQRCWRPARQHLWRAGLPWLVLVLISAGVVHWYALHHATQPSGLAGFFHYPERAVLGGSLAAGHSRPVHAMGATPATAHQPLGGRHLLHDVPVAPAGDLAAGDGMACRTGRCAHQQHCAAHDPAGLCHALRGGASALPERAPPFQQALTTTFLLIF